MTAAELFEIVKDVPREAWPTMVRNHSTFDPAEPERFWIIYGPMGGDDKRCVHITADIAELAFIGSMTAWLCGRNIEIKRQSHENSQLRYTVTACNGWEDVVSVHVELVAALAAACKEAA